MSQFEQVVDLEGSAYNECLIVNKRGDNYQIILGNKPRTASGTVTWKMCYPQFDKKPRDIAVPWGVSLGSLTQARDVIRNLAKAFGLKEPS
jgi:hypothetical protein